LNCTYQKKESSAQKADILCFLIIVKLVMILPVDGIIYLFIGLE